MRLDIRPTGYRSAAAVLLDANQALAMSYDSFVTALHGYGAMAGSDVCGEQFAGEYDVAAAAAVGAYADLVSAFGTLSSLTAASLANHRRADAASVIGGSTVYGGDELPSGTVTVQLATPPSALGGDGWGPWWWDRIADQVGALFPDADCDRLRAAAELWWHHADAIGRLVDHCDRAAAAYRTQTSPEVSAAVAAFEGLAVQVRGVASLFADMGDACRSYSQAVEDARRELLAEGAEFVAWSVGIQAAGAGIGLISAGIATGAAQLAQAAKVALFIKRLREILTLLRVAVGVRIAAVALVRTRALKVSADLRKFTSARVIINGAGTSRLPSMFTGRVPQQFIRKVLWGWLKPGNNRMVRLVDSPGELRRLYDEVVEGATLVSRPNTSKHESWYRLKDGTMVGWRSSSGSGGATIDIQFPGAKKLWKVHLT